MNEHVRESRRILVWSAAVILCAMAGTWWGIRIGGAILWRGGPDLRPELCGFMLLALLIQGLSNLKKDRRYNALYRIFIWYSGIMIPVLIYGLGAIFALDIVTFIWHCLSGTDRSAAYNISALVSLPVSAAVTIYGLIHARQIKVAYYHVRLPGLQSEEPGACQDPARAGGAHRLNKEDANPDRSEDRAKSEGRICRIVQLSDLHAGSVVSIPYVRKVLRKAQALHPDYVMLTGDTFNHGFVEECPDPHKLAALFQRFGQSLLGKDPAGQKYYTRKHSRRSGEAGQSHSMKNNRHRVKAAHAVSQGSSAPEEIPAYNGNSRVFAVLGNHDPLPYDKALRRFLREGGITLLNNRIIALPEFNLAGRTGNHMAGRPALNSWLADQASGRPLILLDHYPDGVYEAAAQHVDLMLAGHTHGGQYFPCNLLIRRHYAHGKLVHGYSVWNHTQCIVSNGAGFFQIPIRIGTSSEIVCIDLEPDRSEEKGTK